MMSQPFDLLQSQSSEQAGGELPSLPVAEGAEPMGAPPSTLFPATPSPPTPAFGHLLQSVGVPRTPIVLGYGIGQMRPLESFAGTLNSGTSAMTRGQRIAMKNAAMEREQSLMGRGLDRMLPPQDAEKEEEDLLHNLSQAAAAQDAIDADRSDRAKPASAADALGVIRASSASGARGWYNQLQQLIDDDPVLKTFLTNTSYFHEFVQNAVACCDSLPGGQEQLPPLAADKRLLASVGLPSFARSIAAAARDDRYQHAASASAQSAARPVDQSQLLSSPVYNPPYSASLMERSQMAPTHAAAMVYRNALLLKEHASESNAQPAPKKRRRLAIRYVDLEPPSAAGNSGAGSFDAASAAAAGSSAAAAAGPAAAADAADSAQTGAPASKKHSDVRQAIRDGFTKALKHLFDCRPGTTRTIKLPSGHRVPVWYFLSEEEQKDILLLVHYVSGTDVVEPSVVNKNKIRYNTANDAAWGTSLTKLYTVYTRVKEDLIKYVDMRQNKPDEASRFELNGYGTTPLMLELTKFVSYRRSLSTSRSFTFNTEKYEVLINQVQQEDADVFRLYMQEYSTYEKGTFAKFSGVGKNYGTTKSKKAPPSED